jgi:hypothetical protein
MIRKPKEKEIKKMFTEVPKSSYIVDKATGQHIPVEVVSDYNVIKKFILREGDVVVSTPYGKCSVKKSDIKNP